MAKIKTGYRPKSPEVIPQPDRSAAAAPNIEPQPETEIKSDALPIEKKSEAEKYAEQVALADQAKAGIARELEALQRAEQLNRQAMQAPQRPPSRDELLEQWRRQGLPPEDEEFLKQHPQLIDGWELTAYAANEAAKEHQRGTAEHREATLKVFDETLARLQAQVAANNSAQQPTPEFFRPEPTPQRQPPSRSAIVSAPVSREAPGSGYRSDFQDNPKSVRLSLEQREAAKLSGISEIEYAKQLIRMRKLQAEGGAQP